VIFAKRIKGVSAPKLVIDKIYFNSFYLFSTKKGA